MRYAAESGQVEKIVGFTDQLVRFRFKGRKYDTIISLVNVVFEIED